METRESISVPDGFAGAVELAFGCFRALLWADELQIGLALLKLSKSQLMQTTCCHRAVLVHADGKVRRQSGIVFPCHICIVFVVINGYAAVVLYLQALKFVILLRKSPVSCRGKTRVRMIL